MMMTCLLKSSRLSTRGTRMWRIRPQSTPKLSKHWTLVKRPSAIRKRETSWALCVVVRTITRISDRWANTRLPSWSRRMEASRTPYSCLRKSPSELERGTTTNRAKSNKNAKRIKHLFSRDPRICFPSLTPCPLNTLTARCKSPWSSRARTRSLIEQFSKRRALKGG